MSRISIFETIGDAYRFCWAGRRDFLMLAFLPVLVLALLGALEYALVPAVPPVVETDDGELMPVSFRPVRVLLFAVALVLYVMFAVAWHRRFLAPGETPAVGAALRWGGRQTRFLARVVALAVIGALVAAAGALLIVLPLVEIIGIAGFGLQFLTTVAVALAAVTVYSRFLPLLPAAAVDAPLGFRACWRLTRGYSPHMVLIGILPVLPMLLAALMASVLYGNLATAIGLLPSMTGVFLGTLIVQAINYAGVAVTVSALSIAYRDLTATGPVATT